MESILERKKIFSIDVVAFYLVKLLSGSLLFSSLLFKAVEMPITFVSALLLLLHIALVIAYRKFKPFAFFLLFVIPNTLVAHLHFLNPNIPLHFSTAILDFDKEEYYYVVFVIVSIFWSIVGLILPQLKRPLVLKEYLPVYNQPVIFYIILSIQIFIVLFGKSGDSIFQSGGYGSTSGNVENFGSTSLFEYFLVFYPVAYIFSGLGKRRIYLLLIVCIIFCIKAISFGGRIETLQCILMIFILHFDNSRTSLFKLVLAAIPILFLFILYGSFRSNTSSNIIEIGKTLTDNIGTSGYFLLANQIDVYYSSARLVGFCQTGLLSISDRLEITFYNILAIVTPYKYLPEQANLAAYKKDQYFAGGGGLISVFFYVYLSYIGVVLFRLGVGYFFRKIMIKTKQVSVYFIVYIMMLLATYPRWYAYSPNVFYKYCLYSVLILFLFKILNNSIVYREESKNHQ